MGPSSFSTMHNLESASLAPRQIMPSSMSETSMETSMRFPEDVPDTWQYPQAQMAQSRGKCGDTHHIQPTTWPPAHAQQIHMDYSRLAHEFRAPMDAESMALYDAMQRQQMQLAQGQGDFEVLPQSRDPYSDFEELDRRDESEGCTLM